MGEKTNIWKNYTPISHKAVAKNAVAWKDCWDQTDMCQTQLEGQLLDQGSPNKETSGCTWRDHTSCIHPTPSHILVTWGPPRRLMSLLGSSTKGQYVCLQSGCSKDSPLKVRSYYYLICLGTVTGKWQGASSLRDQVGWREQRNWPTPGHGLPRWKVFFL